MKAKAYRRYLESEQWKRLRQEALAVAGNRCQLCNSPDRLQVHHRTYERVGHERLSDLIVLCGGCHRRHHHKPRIIGRSGMTRGERRRQIEEDVVALLGEGPLTYRQLKGMMGPISPSQLNSRVTKLIKTRRIRWTHGGKRLELA